MVAATAALRISRLKSVRADVGTGVKSAIVRLGAAPQTLTRVRVKGIFNNHLRCRAWDGATEGDDDILDAKPFKLRHILTEYPQRTP